MACSPDEHCLRRPPPVLPLTQQWSCTSQPRNELNRQATLQCDHSRHRVRATSAAAIPMLRTPHLSIGVRRMPWPRAQTRAARQWASRAAPWNATDDTVSLPSPRSSASTRSHRLGSRGLVLQGTSGGAARPSGIAVVRSCSGASRHRSSSRYCSMHLFIHRSTRKCSGYLANIPARGDSPSWHCNLPTTTRIAVHTICLKP